jgi:putative transposase
MITFSALLAKAYIMSGTEGYAMKRTNTFSVRFNGQGKKVARMADGCARLWNTLNYRRRQAFSQGDMSWDSTVEYEAFKGVVGSATAQQVIRKNDQAWKAFYQLLRMKREGRLPPHIRRVRPPGYWKDRDGNRVLRIIVRNDCYTLKGKRLKLPFGIKAKVYGESCWEGKQGALEIRYDKQKGKWYAHQAVETRPILLPTGGKRAYVDIGVKYPICGLIEGDTSAIAYSGASPLSDWWYHNRRIAGEKGRLETVNKRKTSKELRRLYRRRRLRFRQAVNEVVRDFVERCYFAGVSEIVAGDLTGIRENGGRWNSKSNEMVHNFWSHRYLTDRLRWTAENFGIKVRLDDEHGSSSRCPWCGSEEYVRRGRLFKCKYCGIEAHRDVVGALNIGLVHSRGGGVNRVMAHPVVVPAGRARRNPYRLLQA